MGEQVGQIAVVGHEDQPFAHPVEPADREQPPLTGHEIDHPRPPGGIEVGGHGPHRLVEQIHNPLRIRQPLAVDADLLRAGIDPRAEFAHDRPIDLDPAGGDQLLAGAAAAEAGRRKHLLEPLLAVVGQGGLA